jgi:hypothetical protein
VVGGVHADLRVCETWAGVGRSHGTEERRRVRALARVLPRLSETEAELLWPSCAVANGTAERPHTTTPRNAQRRHLTAPRDSGS